MDYVREELLRQQKLLAALMSGRPKAKEGAESGPERTSGREEIWSGTSSGTGAAVEETGGTGLETTALRVRISRPDQEKRDSATVEASSERETQSEPSADRAVESDGWAKSVQLGMPDADDWGWAPVLRRSAAGGTDAQTVSRAIQRDARRYDGGFTIY